jgi:hypothetical protein
MKLSDAKEKYESAYFSHVEIRKNPSAITENIAFLHSRDGKSFMLCDENERVLSSSELEKIVVALKQVGFRKAKLHF